MRHTWIAFFLLLSLAAAAAPVRPSAEELAESGLNPAEVGHFHFVAGKGCGRCRVFT